MSALGSTKLGAIPDDKSVKIPLALPADVHRDLVAYGEALARESGQTHKPAKLIAPMLARFLAKDRAFAKQRRQQQPSLLGAGLSPPPRGVAQFLPDGFSPSC